MGNQDRWSQSAQDFYGREAYLKQEQERYQRFTQAYKKLLDRVSLTESTTILDLGCGAGEMSHAIRSSVKHYVGIDISTASLQVAKTKNPDSLFVCADMTSIPFSASFDFVLAMTSLEFCYDKNAALKNIDRMLSDTGKVYLEVRNADFLLFKVFAPLTGILTRVGLIVPYEAEGFQDFTYEEWCQILTGSGFRIVSLQPSLRPVWYGGLMTKMKNMFIKLVSTFSPVRYHYMTGFLCIKS